MKSKKSFLSIVVVALSSLCSGALGQSFCYDPDCGRQDDRPLVDLVALEEEYAKEYGTPYFFSSWKHDPAYAKHCQEQWGLLKERINSKDHPYQSFFIELVDKIEDSISLKAINSQHIVALGLMYLYWQERYEERQLNDQSGERRFGTDPSLNALYDRWNREVFHWSHQAFTSSLLPSICQMNRYEYAVHFWPLVGEGELTIEYLNEYFLKGLFPIPLAEEPTEADGVLMSPYEFMDHDFGHAAGFLRSHFKRFLSWTCAPAGENCADCVQRDLLKAFLSLQRLENFRKCIEKRMQQDPENMDTKEASMDLFTYIHENGNEFTQPPSEVMLRALDHCEASQE